MKRSLIRILGVTVACAGLFAPTARAQTDYFQQDVHYTIRAKLDADRHILTGTESIAYRNNSPDTLHVFFLHLYPNAYRSKNSELLKNYSAVFNSTFLNLPEAYRGYLDIADVTVDGTPVTPRIDDTIAQWSLPSPLAPGDSMTISLRFEEKIRRHIGRAGYRGNHYDMAQWYPKVVVYDENGFHPDKFRRGEFYGEFGTFDVHLELPENFVVAATGVLRDGDPGWSLNPPDGSSRNPAKPSRDTKTVHFHAENVHDFAWCADPTFAVQDTTVRGVEVRSFYRRDNVAWADTTLAHAVRAMDWLEGKVGKYPYPQVSVVDALLGGGMEYPMLVMDGRVSEGLVLHEIGHIYFYGILGNDEREEAWMDEGFTTFQTSWYKTARYGKYGSSHDWSWYQRLTPQFTEWQTMRNRIFPLLRAGYGERIATRAEDFQNDYYNHVYRKAALMLHALRYVVGEETFEQILQTYYDRWKLKHVNEARFREVCEEVSGTDLGLFFEQWLHTRKNCDYRLTRAKSGPSPRGDGYVTDVTIERIGEMIMPLELRFYFEDGSVESSRLDGKLRTINRSFDFPERPKRVALNPDNEIADLYLADNFVPRRRAFQFDWPNNHYFPEDAYQIRYRPAIWFNDIDGIKSGIHFSGAYANRYRRLKLGLYYGAKSGRLDFSASYTKPVKFFSKNATLRFSGYKMEGRQDASFDFRWFKRLTLLRPPTQTFGIALNHHELSNQRFVTDPEQYETSPEFAPVFSYSVDPQFDVARTRLDVSLRLGREWFGAEYEYSKFLVTATLRSPRDLRTFLPIEYGLRLFMGFVGGSMPVQQKIFLAGGGPLAEERRFFLRSPGAIWDEANYHEPGHGNLRGYLEGSFPVNQLVAANFEIGGTVPLLSSNKNRWPGTVKAHAFVDVARSFDNDNPVSDSPRIGALVDAGILDETLVDAGIGITLHRLLPFYDAFVRFDIPFYVNNPQINGESDETKYRYVLSLLRSF